MKKNEPTEEEFNILVQYTNILFSRCQEQTLKMLSHLPWENNDESDDSGELKILLKNLSTTLSMGILHEVTEYFITVINTAKEKKAPDNEVVQAFTVLIGIMDRELDARFQRMNMFVENKRK